MRRVRVWSVDVPFISFYHKNTNYQLNKITRRILNLHIDTPTRKLTDVISQRYKPDAVSGFGCMRGVPQWEGGQFQVRSL
jgi:hypothetical protein